jgi:hypothetical protein
MTAIAGLLSDRDRRRLAERVAELRDLDRTMRQRGGMPAVPEPPALHRIAAAKPATTTTGGQRPMMPSA